jgi:hypothetical protein
MALIVLAVLWKRNGRRVRSVGCSCMSFDADNPSLPAPPVTPHPNRRRTMQPAVSTPARSSGKPHSHPQTTTTPPPLTSSPYLLFRGTSSVASHGCSHLAAAKTKDATLDLIEAYKTCVRYTLSFHAKPQIQNHANPARKLLPNVSGGSEMVYSRDVATSIGNDTDSKKRKKLTDLEREIANLEKVVTDIAHQVLGLQFTFPLHTSSPKSPQLASAPTMLRL